LSFQDGSNAKELAISNNKEDTAQVIEEYMQQLAVTEDQTITPKYSYRSLYYINFLLDMFYNNKFAHKCYKLRNLLIFVQVRQYYLQEIQ